jgi:hypothetical protein
VWLLALLCAVLGLIVAIFEAEIFMAPMQWFVLGILFALLNGNEGIAFPRFQRAS